MYMWAYSMCVKIRGTTVGVSSLLSLCRSCWACNIPSGSMTSTFTSWGISLAFLLVLGIFICFYLLSLLLLEIHKWCGCCCGAHVARGQLSGVCSPATIGFRDWVQSSQWPCTHTLSGVLTIKMFRQGLGMELSGRAHIYEVLSLVPGTKKKSWGIVEIQTSLCSTASPFSAVITPYICWIWWFTNLGICLQSGFTEYISATT